MPQFNNPFGCFRLIHTQLLRSLGTLHLITHKLYGTVWITYGLKSINILKTKVYHSKRRLLIIINRWIYVNLCRQPDKLGVFTTPKSNRILNIMCLKLIKTRQKLPKVLLGNRAQSEKDGEMYLLNHFGNLSMASLRHLWGHFSIFSQISMRNSMLLFLVILNTIHILSTLRNRKL